MKIESEEQWLTGSEPAPLLAHVRETAPARKMRLFACACVRQVWSSLLDEISQRAIELAEGFADGLISAAELATTHSQAAEVAHLAGLRDMASDSGWSATRAAARASDPRSDPFRIATGTAFLASISQAPWSYDPLDDTVQHRGDPDTRALARLEQADLVREIFGNPFRPLEIASAWLGWEDGTIVRLARTLYHERRFDELPILADALEEAGCSEQVILDHCRQRGGHVPGCWALDLILVGPG